MAGLKVFSDKNEDFLSESYLQSIERITGTKDDVINFHLPKELLEAREKRWNNLFGKYSENKSDEIELNMDTLEPEEEEEGSEEECSCEQRTLMRIPATLIQYWINTGNPPYKALLDKKEPSESGSSLSEKEITLLCPPFSNEVIEGGKQTQKSNSSCSSVDTAAYILSNANVTKKADTIAIMEGAKYTSVESSKSVSKDLETVDNDKTKYILTLSVNEITHNKNNNVNTNITSDSFLDTITMEQATLRTDGELNTSTVVPSQHNMSSENLSYDKTDRMDVLSPSQKKLNVQNLNDIVSIFQQFNKTLKQFPGNVKNNNKDPNEMPDKYFNKEEVSENNIAEKTVATDTSFTSLHRKKLYTGRNSPVDLILMERNRERDSINKLSKKNSRLHPALDNNTVNNKKRKTFLIQKEKKKHQFSSDKKSLKFEKIEQKRKKEQQKRKKRSSKEIAELNDVPASSEDIDTINEIQVTNSDKSYDSIIDKSSRSLSNSYNNLEKQNNDILVGEYNNENIHVTDKICIQDLGSLNLNPIVLLERIMPFTKKYESNSIKNTKTQKNNMNNEYLNISKKQHICEVENLESETIDSDRSTILICECKHIASKHSSSPSESSFDFRLNVTDKALVSSVENNDKLLNLKGINMNQDKKPYVVLERLQSTIKNYINTTMKTQCLNMNKSILNKSITHLFNSSGINKTDNIKLQEPKVILKRLPEDIYLKRSTNITNTNISVDKKEISQNMFTNLHTNKREFNIATPTHVNVRTSTQTINRTDNDYSSKTHTKSKEKSNEENDEINYIYDNASRYENQISDKVVTTNSVSQHKSYNNQVNQDKNSKYSILSLISSDEDDFIQLLQPPKKKLKVLTGDYKINKENTTEKNLYDETKLVNTDKEKYDYSKNLSTVNYSSKKIKPKRNDSTEVKKRKKEIEIKSFDNDVTLSTSLQTCKNKRYSFFSNESDSNSAARDLGKQKKIYSFFNSSRNSNNSKKHSDTTIKKNKDDHKNDTSVILFQTKVFNIVSSDSEGNTDNDNEGIKPTTVCTREPLNKFTRRYLRNHNRINNKEFFNDSFAKKYNKKQPISLNFSVEEYDIENRTQNIRNKSTSVSNKKVNINERFIDTSLQTCKNKRYSYLSNESDSNSIDKEFNGNVNLNATTNMSRSSVINGSQDIFKKKEQNVLQNGFPGRNNLSKSLKSKLFEKSKFENSQTTQQHDIKSTVTSLTFQTKSYYDSDSSESS